MNAQIIKPIQALISAKRYRQAIKRLNECLEDNNGDVQALNLRAYCWFKVGKLKEAENDVHNVLGIKAENIRALKTQFEIKVERNDIDQVIKVGDKILSVRPDDLDFRKKLIKILMDSNQVAKAIQQYSQMIELPSGSNQWELYVEYANLLQSQEQSAQAMSVYAKAAELKDCPQNTRIEIVNMFQNSGEYAKAVPVFKRLIKESPEHLALYQNLAIALRNLGDFDQSIQTFQQLLNIDGNYIDALTGCANVHSDLGQYELTEKLLLKAIDIDNKLFAAHFNLANTYQTLGKLDLAVKYFDSAIKINPNYSGCYNNLGNVYKSLGRSSDARNTFEKALSIESGTSMVHSNLGALYCDAGMMELSKTHYEKALALEPNNISAISNYLYFLNYIGEYDDLAISEMHKNLASRFVVQGTFSFETPKPQDSTRQLKIGYVSGDFRRHSVAFFFQPLLECHNRHDFEIFCYSNNKYQDALTASLKESADQWRDIRKLEDKVVVDMIFKDEIDILVDLSGHTDGNRLNIFASKPAPIQVSWLGYPNTTGLTEIDYRLSDDVCDPLGATEELHSEKIVRLDTGFLCYRGEKSIEPAKESPYIDNGYVTFGSFNNITKITDQVKQLWSEVLSQVPNSRLLLKSKLFVDIEISDKLYSDFAALDIDSSRIDLRSYVNSYEEHMSIYDEVDIALDTFPYNGTTTTCEALWMGVPVITLTEENHRSRVSASILERIGYEQWVAESKENYVSTAVSLAENSAELQSVKSGLRSKMISADLCNEQKFTDAIELVYRSIWQDYIQA